MKKNKYERGKAGVLFSVLLLSLGLMASEASATIILYGQNGVYQGGSAATAARFLDLSGSSSGIQASRLFTTSKRNQLVRVLVNMSAYMYARRYAYLENDILIDDKPCSPTGNTVPNYMISQWQSSTLDYTGSTAVATQCITFVPDTGVHTFKIRINPSSTTLISSWWINGLSFVIDI
jgi:hypothetical protein